MNVSGHCVSFRLLILRLLIFDMIGINKLDMNKQSSQT